MLMDFKILPFELKSASGDGSEFAGHANAFFNVDTVREIVDTGSFADTIPQFMEDGFIGGLNHNWDSPIGKPVSATEDAKGLFVEGKISPTEHGKDCMILLKDKVVRKMSIGYRVLGDAMLEDAEAVDAYWKSRGYTPSAKDVAMAQHGVRLLTKLHLYEFSPVTVPANSMADITRVKRYDTDDLVSYSDMEKTLRDVGLSQKAAKIWVSGFKALYQRDVEEADTEEGEEKSDPPQEPEVETPPVEPEPDLKTEEADAEAKQERETNVPAPVVVNVAANLHQSHVQALYANLLDIKARYGLGAP